MNRNLFFSLVFNFKRGCFECPILSCWIYVRTSVKTQSQLSLAITSTRPHPWGRCYGDYEVLKVGDGPILCTISKMPQNSGVSDIHQAWWDNDKSIKSSPVINTPVLKKLHMIATFHHLEYEDYPLNFCWPLNNFVEKTKRKAPEVRLFIF